MYRKFIIPVLLGFILLMSVDAHAQCAMCKAVAENNDSGVADGLNTGILYMMAFPYLLATTVAILWYRHNKKTKQAQGQ